MTAYAELHHLKGHDPSHDVRLQLRTAAKGIRIQIIEVIWESIRWASSKVRIATKLAFFRPELTTTLRQIPGFGWLTPGVCRQKLLT